MTPLTERIGFVRVCSTIIFAILLVGLGVLTWQLVAEPEPVTVVVPATDDVQDLEQQVAELLKKLEGAQSDLVDAGNRVAELTERFNELQKENTDLRASLAKIKEEMRNREGKQQTEIRKLEKTIEAVREKLNAAGIAEP